MKGAEFDIDTALQSGLLKDLDVLITETTYGGKKLPDRSILEQQFRDAIMDVLHKGSVIVPVYALGRAQEVLLVLSKQKWPVPIYFDGMCIDLTKTILKRNPAYINNRNVLIDMFNKRVTPVSSQSKRESVMNAKGIFITTSGMLQGGPVLGYIEQKWGDANSAIFLTGYQCKRTNGRMLQEEGVLYLNGWKTQVKCQVKTFSFSGHADDDELKTLIQKLNPKNIVLVHGDPESGDSIKAWALKSTPAKIFTPNVGDTIEF